MFRYPAVFLLTTAWLLSACVGGEQPEQHKLAEPPERILVWDEQLAELAEAYADLGERWDAFVELALPSGTGRSSDQLRINDNEPLHLADLMDRRPPPSDEDLAELTLLFNSLYAESREMYAGMRVIVTNAANLSTSEREEVQQILEEITQAERALVAVAELLQRWQEANAHTGKNLS